MRVVGALEGDDKVTETEGATDGSEIALKVIRPLWSDLQSVIMDRLDHLTVEDLCARANALHIDSEAARVPDFSI
jgi:DNA-binding IscR family transcriptional regulator